MSAALIAALALPSPAFALRVSNPKEAGLEEELSGALQKAPAPGPQQIARTMMARREFLAICGLMPLTISAVVAGSLAAQGTQNALLTAQEKVWARMYQAEWDRPPPTWGIAADPAFLQDVEQLLTAWRTADNTWRRLARQYTSDSNALTRLQARHREFFEEVKRWLAQHGISVPAEYSLPVFDTLVLETLVHYLASKGVVLSIDGAETVVGTKDQGPVRGSPPDVLLTHYFRPESMYRVRRVRPDRVVEIDPWLGLTTQPSFSHRGFASLGVVFLIRSALDNALARERQTQARLARLGSLLVATASFWVAEAGFQGLALTLDQQRDRTMAEEFAFNKLLFMSSWGVREGTPAILGAEQEIDLANTIHEGQHRQDSQSRDPNIRRMMRTTVGSDEERDAALRRRTASQQAEIRAYLAEFRVAPRQFLMDLMRFGESFIPDVLPADLPNRYQANLLALRVIFRAIIEEIRQRPARYGVELRPASTIPFENQIIAQLYQLGEFRRPEHAQRMADVLERQFGMAQTPPWYRTTPAYITYGVTAALGIGAVALWHAHRMTGRSAPPVLREAPPNAVNLASRHRFESYVRGLALPALSSIKSAQRTQMARAVLRERREQGFFVDAADLARRMTGKVSPKIPDAAWTTLAASLDYTPPPPNTSPQGGLEETARGNALTRHAVTTMALAAAILGIGLAHPAWLAEPATPTLSATNRTESTRAEAVDEALDRIYRAQWDRPAPPWRIADLNVQARAEALFTRWRTHDQRAVALADLLRRDPTNTRFMTIAENEHRVLFEYARQWLEQEGVPVAPSYSQSAFDTLFLETLVDYLASKGLVLKMASAVTVGSSPKSLVQYLLSDPVYQITQIRPDGRVVIEPLHSTPQGRVVDGGFAAYGTPFLVGSAIAMRLNADQRDRAVLQRAGIIPRLQTASFWTPGDGFLEMASLLGNGIHDPEAARRFALVKLLSQPPWVMMGGQPVRMEEREEAYRETGRHEDQHVADYRSRDPAVQRMMHLSDVVVVRDEVDRHRRAELHRRAERRGLVAGLRVAPRRFLINLLSAQKALPDPRAPAPASLDADDLARRDVYQAVVGESLRHPKRYGIVLRKVSPIPLEFQAVGQIAELADPYHPKRAQRMADVLEQQFGMAPPAVPWYESRATVAWAAAALLGLSGALMSLRARRLARQRARLELRQGASNAVNLATEEALARHFQLLEAIPGDINSHVRAQMATAVIAERTTHGPFTAANQFAERMLGRVSNVKRPVWVAIAETLDYTQPPAAPPQGGLEETAQGTLPAPLERRPLPDYETLMQRELAIIKAGRTGKPSGQVYWVGVNGVAAAGKSRLADALVERLRAEGLHVIHLSEDALGVRAAAERDAWKTADPTRWRDWRNWVRWEEIRQTFQRITAAARDGSSTVQLPLLYDFPTRALREADPIAIVPNSLIVYDGTLLFDPVQYPPDTFDHVLLLDIASEEAVRRNRARAASRGRSAEQAVEGTVQAYLPAWHDYVARFHPEQQAASVYDMTDLARPVQLIYHAAAGLEEIGRPEIPAYKRAVIFGGLGNIGRGYLAPLLAADDFDLLFADLAQIKDQPNPLFVAAHTQRGDGSYVVTPVGAGQPMTVQHFWALDARDTAAVAAQGPRADWIFTAVGAGNIIRLAPTLYQFILRRVQTSHLQTLNIVFAENLPVDQPEIAKVKQAVLAMAGDPATRDYINERVHFIGAGDEQLAFSSYVDGYVGWPGAVVHITVPPTIAQTSENPLDIKVEGGGPYSLEVDAKELRGIPFLPSGIRPVENIRAAREKKLLVHNMGHAALAYLASALGMTDPAEAIRDPRVVAVVRTAMRESAQGLSQRYPTLYPMPSLDQYIEELIERFGNRDLHDTIERIAKDPLRKLAENDRLFGAFLSAKAAGVSPEAISLAIAAAVRYAREMDHLSEQQLAPILALAAKHGVALSSNDDELQTRVKSLATGLEEPAQVAAGKTAVILVKPVDVIMPTLQEWVMGGTIRVAADAEDAEVMADQLRRQGIATVHVITEHNFSPALDQLLQASGIASPVERERILQDLRTAAFA